MTELGQTVSKNVFNSFVTKLNNDSKIKVLGNKMKDATDYEVANEYAVRVGEIASEALQTETKGLAYISNEVAQEVLEPILNANYEIVKEATKQVQQNMNTANGLGVEVLTPDLDTSRIQGLVDKVSSYATAEEGNWVLGEPIINYTQAIVDQSIHKNAKAHSKLGLEPVIIRKTESSGTRYKKIRRGKKTYSYPYKVPCKWCSGLAGTYNYSEVRETGNDVFRRHENCRCLIVYKEGNKAQDVRTKTEWTEEEAKKQVETVERALEEQKNNNSKILEQKKYEKSFIPANDYSEAKKYAEDVLGVQYVGIEQAHVSFLNEMNKDLSRIYDIFGNLHENEVLNYINKFSRNGSAVACYGGNSGSVALRTSGLRGKNALGKLLEQAIEQNKVGFWSSADSMTVFRHEVGHAVEQLYYQKGSPMIKSKIKALRNEALKEAGVKYWDIKDLEHMEKAGEVLSYYGLRNESEFIAESVASYLSDNPKPLAVEVVETLLSEGKK